MANKAALGVIGAIVAVSFGAGLLVGMQVGGGGPGVGGAGGTPTESGPTPIPVETGSTPTPVPTAAATTTVGPPTATQTPTETATTPTRPERTTVPARRFDRREIAQTVKRLINERRAEQGLSQLAIQGQTVDRLDGIARVHSEVMADSGRVGHNIEGNSSQDRYRRAGLFQTCQFPSDAGGYLVTAESNNLEAVTRTIAGRPYQRGSEMEFNQNGTAVARTIVNNWFNSMVYEPRLTYQNAERIGVGLAITRDGTVYATANIC